MFFPDVAEEPKSFFQNCVQMDLDLCAPDCDGTSILSLLLSSNSFELAGALVEVACETSPSVVDQILLTICKDESTHTFWKSSLVGKILSFPKQVPDVDLTPALRSCFLNVKSLYKSGLLEFQKETNNDEPPLEESRKDTSSKAKSVHLDIVHQLRLHGANVLCCEDLCADVPSLHTLLTKEIDLDQAPISIPWTSYSTKHEGRLQRVARKQNAVSITSYWYHKEPIGSGAFGDVFAGINGKDGREVAIKKIVKRKMNRPQDVREITNLIAMADCLQVVKYICYDDTDKDFAYIVLELVEGQLDDYFESPSFKPLQNFSLCKDLVMGVKYLHDHKPAAILHRDLKPSNILYKVHPKLCLKIADFGLSSHLSSTGSTVLGTNAGTRCWIAPEVIMSSTYQHSKESDIFSCGLLLHYILSQMKHPFSPVDCSNKSTEFINQETQSNMLGNKMDGWDNTLPPEAKHLIKRLLSWEAKERPSAAFSLSHPLFWSDKKKLDFLSAVGNQPEMESNCPAHRHLTPFESDMKTLFPTIVKYPRWNDTRYIHMAAIYDEMTKTIVRVKRPPSNPRQYNPTSLIELIRFIRNTMAQVSVASRPKPIRKQILEDAVFLQYFPNLVMEVYQTVIDKHGWDKREEISHVMSCTDL